MVAVETAYLVLGQGIHAEETGSSQNWKFPNRRWAHWRIYIPTIPNHYQTHFLSPSTSLTLTLSLILILNLNLNQNLNLKYSFEWSAKKSPEVVLRWKDFSKPGIEPEIFELEAGILLLRQPPRPQHRI